MNDWEHRYEQALLRALHVAPPETSPAPGERHLRSLFWPTFHASLVVELVDLGAMHELSVAVVDREVSDFAFAVTRGREEEVLPPSAPTWHRGALSPEALSGLRARLDAFDAASWPPVGQGRDGMSVIFSLRDGRGRQRLSWSTATHDLAGAPFELAIELLVQAAAIAPALRDSVAEVRRYLRA